MIRFNKKIIPVMAAAAAAIAVLCTSCTPAAHITEDPQPPGRSTIVPDAETIAEALEKKYLVRLPLDTLDHRPEVTYLGDGKVFFIEKTAEYAFEDEENNRHINDTPAHTRVFDIMTGVTAPGPDVTNTTFIFRADRQTGTVMLCDTETDAYTLYDRDMNKVFETVISESGGRFSTDCSRYYSSEGGYLKELDTATGEARFIDVPYGFEIIYIDSLDADRNILYVSVASSKYSYGTARMGLDMSDWHIAELTPNVLSSTYFDGREYFRDYNDDGSTGIFCRDGKAVYSVVPSSSSGRLMDCWILKDSPYCACSCFDEGDGTFTNSLIRMGTDMRVFDFSGYCSSAVEYSAYMTDADMILAVIGEGQADGSGYTLAVIRTDIMPFESMSGVRTGSRETLRQDIIDRYIEESAIPEVDPELADIQAEADRLSEEYGITIAVSNQCRTPLKDAKYKIDYTDALDGAEEKRLLSLALPELEAALRKYPRGFLRQFRDIRGNGGICIYLVSRITSGYGVIGFHSRERNRYDVVLDISDASVLESTVGHEMWHATEDKASSALFNWYSAWEGLNPEGFEYLMDYSLEDPDPAAWIYNDLDPDSVFFVDTYAKTFPTEDRARIMEYVMTEHEITGALMKCPHILAKLRVMCEAVRQAFDTAGWTDVLWERYTAE